MKILFLGRGAIATMYAWAFEKAGHTVEFYVRPGRREGLGPQVRIDLWDGRRGARARRIQDDWSIVLKEEIEAPHDYDLVFLSVNAEQVAGAVSTLSSFVGSATVLFFGNFWGDPRIATSPIPGDQLVLGLGGGGGFEGNVLHAGLPKAVEVGTFAGPSVGRERAVHQLFVDAGFQVTRPSHPQSWLWNHYAMNVAMEIEVLKYGSFEAVASSRQALNGVGSNVRDLVQVLRAKGSRIAPLTKILGTLPPSLVGLLLSSVMSPRGVHYALMKHNHFKVGFAVRELIAEARRFNLVTNRLFEVEALASPERTRGPVRTSP